MRLLNVLFGRTRLNKPKAEAIFCIATADITLQSKFNITHSGRAGLCLRPVASSFFEALDQEVQELLTVSSRSTGTQTRTLKDDYGFQWVVLEDPDFDDLVSTIHMLQQAIVEYGFGEQLLAAVFRFDDGGQPLYWIYSYKRGKFYPFAPRAAQRRDNATEVRMGSAMERELPMEPSVEQWYALWGVPV